VLLFGDPGESIGIAADYIKFMIAYNKADFELFFRFPAPFQETGMDIGFITVQSDPEFKDVPEEKNPGRAILQDAVQHLEKGAFFALSQMTVRDQYVIVMIHFISRASAVTGSDDISGLLS
jgi:hypothetical protein